MISNRIFLLVVAVLLLSCAPQQNRTPAIGEAFVGPNTLNLRQELSTKAPVSAAVHHGERLDVLEYKRKFIKVRTAGGIVGWTEVNQLLTPEQMAELRHASNDAVHLPSQGVATSFELLNVHTEPSRTSPSFMQVTEGSKVDVIGHKITPRTQASTAKLTPPPKPKILRRKKDKSGRLSVVPPMPAAPKPPSDWVELSKTPVLLQPKPEPKTPPAPVHLDDWTQIRSKDGKVGWVLSRMLTMGIPDDVAQYAEGHRITSYFMMGDVQDEDQLKHNWLWTTIGKGAHPYEFDSFRFFIWSKRHHRYETAYIQREVVGHYPVEVKNSGDTHEFTLLLEDDDGKLWKKTYGFNGYRVNLLDSAPYDPAAGNEKQSPNLAIAQAQGDRVDSWYANLKARVTKLFHR